jgi:hypothetical protein|tara:strand:+ start:373 stop:540 length:168 start_codon:yes stop_codon:yes gene_type:complete
MDNRRLYEIKIETLHKEINVFKEEQLKFIEEILELRDEVYDWKLKYKELRKTITN